MTNPHKGEIPFKAGGRTYTLRYAATSIVALETELDLGIIAIANEMASWEKNPKNMRFGFIRALLWAGLQEHHPETLLGGAQNPDGVDIRAAGELVMEIGGAIPTFTLIAAGFSSAFPQAETKGARPPNRAARRKAKATTGQSS